ncbi:MAG: NADP-dependent oxidoreductase domain [Adhaeribacter sp.]|nr:NADP-dependent oxidoreductase domain [Adhaeribacter sp.]
MKYNQLGDSNIKVSAIAFGAWAIGGWMWGGSDKKDAINAMHTSLDLGITTIDTAPIYGYGLSEELVGEALAGKRHQAQILTKYGMRWDSTEGQLAFMSKDDAGKDIPIHKFAGKQSVIQECENSLRRLRTDYIDLYQIHWPDVTTPIDETMEAVAQLIQQGKVLASGVCNYTAEQMATAERTLRQATNQVPYSMVQRDIEADVTPYCLEHGKAILAYSPLQRGLLTGKITNDYKFEEGDHRPGTKHFKQPNRDRINNFLEQIRPLADNYGVTLGQLAINWTIQQPAVATALVGARDPKQVKENAKALDFMLSAEDINQINGLLDKLELVG